MASLPVAKRAELADQRRFKVDAWCQLVSSLFSPTVNHDFVCCVLSMMQRYFASYFSQYFGKTNMLSIILTINDTQLRRMSWRFFRTFKTSGVQDFGFCGFLCTEALIKIAYPEWNIMEKTLEVTVCSVNIGTVINTRREVLEALHNYTSVACCYKGDVVFDFFIFF